MRRLLARLFATITYAIYSWPSRARTWLAVKFLRTDRAVLLIKSAPLVAHSVCIVAIYPRTALRDSTLRLLASLRDLRAQVVLVANESRECDNVLDDLSPFADVVIRRPNVGRDFGAYKAGYEYVTAHADVAAIRRLAFFNDSVIYGPNSSWSLRELLDSSHQASAQFVNLQYYPHLQSFAFALNGEVAFSPTLRRFWGTYYPSNQRRHAIHAGEKQLSSLILSEGIPISQVVSSDTLRYSVQGDWSQLLPSELAALWLWVRGRRPLETVTAYAKEDSPDFAPVVTELLIERAFTARNVSHALGLPCSRLLGVPLKLDLVKLGVCSLGDVAACLQLMGLPPDEVKAIMSTVLQSGSDASVTGLERRWRRFGLV